MASGGDSESSEQVTAANSKVDILLKATGDVPILKQKKWKVDGDRTVFWIINYIKGLLKFSSQDSLFLYVSQSFAPSPDQRIRNLFDCFGSDGKLVFYYSKTPAWG